MIRPTGQRFRVLLAGIALVAAGSTLSADPRQSSAIKMEFSGGRVTIVAADVRAADVLAEWCRTGATTIAGADQVPDRRITLNLSDQDEEEALKLIAGPGFGFAGYARSVTMPGTSRFARVTLVATQGVVRAPDPSPTDPPEARFSYPIAERTWPTLPAPSSLATTSTPLDLPDPETVFEYSQPLHARPPSVDGGLSAGLGVTDPLPPGSQLQDPESRFDYSTPIRVLEIQKELENQPPATTPTTPPVAAPPAGDPEARFQYYTPPVAIRPQNSDDVESAGTGLQGVAAPATTVPAPEIAPAESGPGRTTLARPPETMATTPVTPARNGKPKASSTRRVRKPATDK